MKAPTPAVTLSPEFLALAVDFGMLPAPLAERVLAAFVRERPETLTIGRAAQDKSTLDR